MGDGYPGTRTPGDPGTDCIPTSPSRFWVPGYGINTRVPGYPGTRGTQHKNPARILSSLARRKARKGQSTAISEQDFPIVNPVVGRSGKLYTYKP
eukprot:2436887-Rhodomonas_salina.4